MVAHIMMCSRHKYPLDAEFLCKFCGAMSANPPLYLVSAVDLVDTLKTELRRAYILIMEMESLVTSTGHGRDLMGDAFEETRLRLRELYKETHS